MDLFWFYLVHWCVYWADTTAITVECEQILFISVFCCCCYYLSTKLLKFDKCFIVFYFVSTLIYSYEWKVTSEICSSIRRFGYSGLWWNFYGIEMQPQSFALNANVDDCEKRIGKPQKSVNFNEMSSSGPQDGDQGCTIRKVIQKVDRFRINSVPNHESIFDHCINGYSCSWKLDQSVIQTDNLHQCIIKPLFNCISPWYIRFYWNESKWIHLLDPLFKYVPWAR